LRTKLMISLFLVVLVVSATGIGKTIYVDDDGPADFNTIQAAIDDANDGDTVIVIPGLYTGDGNRNIDFKGKAITVRSLYPHDNACMRETVIDAQGQGVIVQFLSDEGPESVFEGFTLVAGDTSISVRGIPGFFEFSDKARPTTNRLRIKPEITNANLNIASSLAADLVSVAEIQEEEIPQTGPPYGSRVWDGNDPFSQPAATTDYYGSGDVDNDGQLTTADVSLAQEIADELNPPNIRADADGDGCVDYYDVWLINEALDGEVLPGCWNYLTNREQRDAWVTNFIRIEETDKHPYVDWFNCFSFAVQTHIHGAFHRADLFGLPYDGGPTVFNLPVYYVSVSIVSFGHGINAILVGDDPLNFDDWNFFEPQLDTDVRPGRWDMPYGSTVRITLPMHITSSSFQPPEDKVEFYVDETDWTLQGYSPDLFITRPEPEAKIPDNRPDLWNPRIVSSEQGMILYERYREDMSRTTDIHVADLPFEDTQEGFPLVGSSQYSRLLDTCKGPDGTIHLLWTGKPDYMLGVFYGKLDPISRSITDMARVSTGEPEIYMGRVIVTTAGEVHIFWFEQKTGYRGGIYWTKWTGSAWQTEQILVPLEISLEDWSDWEKRSLLRYYFDVDLSRNGDIVLVWIESPAGTDKLLCQLRYDGEWGALINLGVFNPCSVELVRDSTGTLHLVSLLGAVQSSLDEGRGALVHQTSEDGYTWSAPKVVDATGNASCPRMASGPEGEVYLIWERREGEKVVPVLRKYESDAWYIPQGLEMADGYNVWYPTIELLANGTLMVAWSSRSRERVTIETQTIDHLWDLDEEIKFPVNVYFPDPNLQYAVEQELGISNPTLIDILGMTSALSLID